MKSLAIDILLGTNSIRVWILPKSPMYLFTKGWENWGPIICLGNSLPHHPCRPSKRSPLFYFHLTFFLWLWFFLLTSTNQAAWRQMNLKYGLEFQMKFTAWNDCSILYMWRYCRDHKPCASLYRNSQRLKRLYILTRKDWPSFYLHVHGIPGLYIKQTKQQFRERNSTWDSASYQPS